ncbi:MAG: hypothetical protein AAF741_13255 [Bacteroidota bacterium]
MPALIILDELLGGSEARVELARIKGRYLDWADLLSSENDAQGSVWQQELHGIIESMEGLLDKVYDQNLDQTAGREGYHLRKSWPKYSHDLALAFGSKAIYYRDQTVFAFVSRMDRVHLPSSLVGEDQQQAYKRAFYKLQDLYHAGEFEAAYQQGLHIRDELESESGQLYEYLLLSLFQCMGADKIIDSAIEHSDYLMLKQIYVYAERLQALQWAGAPVRQASRHPAYALAADGRYSHTAIHNMRQIANGLLLRVTQRYSALISEPDSAASRLSLQRAMWLTGLLGSFTRGDALFAPLVITELAGGGPHATLWIELSDADVMTNRYPDFDALALLRSARRVARYEILPAAERPEATLVADLLMAQRARYETILNDQMLDISEAVILHKLRNWLTNAYLLSFLFPDYPEIADLPIKEMATSTGIADYFGINRDGDLVTKPKDSVLSNFPSYRFLRRFVCWGEGEVAWAKREGELRELAYLRTAAAAKARYAEIVDPAYRIGQRNLNQVQKVISSLKDWIKCYRAYGIDQFWDAAYKEITGSGYFCWFQLSTNGYRDPVLLSKDWSSLRFLKELLGLKRQFDPRVAHTKIAKNYLERFIKPRYEEIRKITENQLNPSIAYRQELYNLMEHALVLCETILPLDDLIDFVYDELIGENILPWLDLHDGQIIDYQRQRYHPVPSGKLLDRVRKVLDEPQTRWQFLAVRETIMVNRYRDIQYDYTHDFSAIRYRNGRLLDRKLMFDLLRQCLEFYELTGDPAYLVLPHREYVAGLGRMRWAYYLRPFRKSKFAEELAPFILFEHWHNWRIDGLSYLSIRRYVKDEWRRHLKAGNLSEDKLMRK